MIHLFFFLTDSNAVKSVRTIVHDTPVFFPYAVMNEPISATLASLTANGKLSEEQHCVPPTYQPARTELVVWSWRDNKQQQQQQQQQQPFDLIGTYSDQ
jgi:hypothetical protein